MLPRLAAGLSGLAWFLAIGGLPTLNPFHTTWLRNDWMQHWLGFLFFKSEPWTFPVGTLASMPYPIGTSIGFTDSNPLISIALKPLAGLLPGEFQVIGWWLLLCFVLQGYFGALLCSTVTPDKWLQGVGGALFALSPVLSMRMGHDTLCAQWLVLAVLYLGLREAGSAMAARRTALLAVACVYLATCIHPYLAVMCMVLAIACFARLRWIKLLPLSSAALLTVVMAAGAGVLAWSIGYFGPERPALMGFGTLSSDLLAFVDPREYSRLLPPLATGWGRGEGAAFLGPGGWIAAAIGVVYLMKRRALNWSGRGFVVAVAVLMAVYALSSDISLNGQVIAQLRELYRPFGSLTSTFRASGRFIWPAHYLVLLLGVWGIARLGTSTARSVAASVFAVVLAVQALDFKAADPNWSRDQGIRQARVANFDRARDAYRHVALYPAQVGSDCGATDEEQIFRYALLAYRLGMTYNSASLARIAHAEVRRLCGEAARQLESGKLDVATIYVVTPEALPAFRKARASCALMDGDWICVSADGHPAFRSVLESAR